MKSIRKNKITNIIYALDSRTNIINAIITFTLYFTICNFPDYIFANSRNLIDARHEEIKHS